MRQEKPTGTGAGTMVGPVGPLPVPCTGTGGTRSNCVPARGAKRLASLFAALLVHAATTEPPHRPVMTAAGQQPPAIPNQQGGPKQQPADEAAANDFTPRASPWKGGWLPRHLTPRGAKGQRSYRSAHIPEQPKEDAAAAGGGWFFRSWLQQLAERTTPEPPMSSRQGAPHYMSPCMTSRRFAWRPRDVAQRAHFEPGSAGGELGAISSRRLTSRTIDARTKAPRYASPRFSSRRSQREISEQMPLYEEAMRRIAQQKRAAMAARPPPMGKPKRPVLRLSVGEQLGDLILDQQNRVSPAERVAARTAIAEQIGEDERKRYRQIFAKFDRDCSGSVSTDEMSVMLRQLGGLLLAGGGGVRGEAATPSPLTTFPSAAATRPHPMRCRSYRGLWMPSPAPPSPIADSWRYGSD